VKTRVLYALRYLSFRYWLRHRGAFALATLGVALGIAVFVAIQIANASVLGAFGASVDAVAGRANLQIRGGASGLPDELFARVTSRDDPAIVAAAPSLSRTLFSPTLQTTVLVAGIDVFSEIDFRPRDLEIAGDDARGTPTRDTRGALRFLLEPDAIAVSSVLARKHNLKVGSSFEVFIGARRQRFRVASILDEAASGRAFGGDYAALDIASAQEAFGEIGQLSNIDLIVDESSIERVTRELQMVAPPDASVSRPAQRTAQIGAMLGAFQLNLTALSSIAAFVGAFLIYNALASAVVRRRSEAGILRSVGASRSQITRLFLVEAAFIGFIGAMIGFCLGIFLAKWTLGAVATTVSQLYLAVKARELFVPVWLLPLSLGAGTVLSVLAAIPAAREAASTSPRATLSGSATLHHALERGAPKLLLGSLALIIAAGILCLPVVSGASPLLGFAAAGATLGAFALSVPSVLLGVAGRIRPLALRFGGIEGALAADNLRRALNRSSLVIAALLVCLALTIGMNLMVRSFRATVADWIDGTISADLFIAPANGFDGERGPGLPREVIDYATSRPEVETFDVVRQADVEIAGQPVVLLANELPSLQSGQRRLRWVETQNGARHALDEWENGRAILLSERLANVLKLRSGDSLEVPTPLGKRNFPIAGVFYDYNPNAVFWMHRSLYTRIWRDEGIDGVALYLASSTSGEAMKTEINARFGARHALTLLPNREIRQTVFETFDQTFAVTYALQLIALVVAAIGVFDTLIAMMLERTTEVAGLRAMGASRRQIQKLAFWEFGLLGGLAWVLGTLAGLVLAAQMIWVINRQFFGWTIFPSFSPVVALQALGLALVAALGAGWLPARLAARRDLATSLHRE
jgi:putative ABC transport system permease protein